MSSHVYLRLGRYHDAVLANQAAVTADRNYATSTIADRAYAAGYALHNQHFLWASALWSGESQLALDTATTMAATVANGPDLQIDAGTRQHLMATPWFTLVRFGRWDDILLATMDSSAGPYLRGVAAYARGTAYAQQGKGARAEQERAALRAARRQASAQKLEIKQTNRAADLLAVAEALLRADIAAARGSRAEAVRHARIAVTREDRLAGDEPPVWQIPARHRLGKALLQAGQARAALAVFEADLERHPANAVALAGRAESERRLGNAAGADALIVQARTAWSHADIPLPVP
jgi:hypothetical protein